MKYISQVETHKMMRKALKAAFPGVKFSVRADHTSSRVEWQDGPSEHAVDEIVQQYRGATFDGMIDLESPVHHIVNGEKVNYGTKYVFTKREAGPEARAAALEWLHGHGFDGLTDDWFASFDLYDHQGYGAFLGLRQESGEYRHVYQMVTGAELVNNVVIYQAAIAEKVAA
jgi:hypothetical protein